jgi:hypothetical protein
MIINNEVEIIITNRNITYYKKLVNDITPGVSKINVNLLSSGSHIKVQVKCDFCNIEKSISYCKYLKNISNHNLYACSNKCAVVKGEMTCIEKYGTKYAIQNKEILEKAVKTQKERQGDYSEVNKKREKTMLERFGVKTNIILPDTHRKAIELSKTNESKQKRKDTNKKLYGVDNYTMTNEYLERTKKTNNDLYGVDHPMKSKIIRDKLTKTFIEKYGVEHPMKIKEFALKAGESSLKSKIKKGISVDRSDITKWINYNRMVRKLTHRNKKELFEKWNGFDYYDNEYILDYLLFEYTHENYPCVDHKISILYGFQNNIPIEEISDINNLCVTKRSINSKKKSSNAEDFLLKIKK